MEGGKRMEKLWNFNLKNKKKSKIIIVIILTLVFIKKIIFEGHMRKQTT